MRLFFQEDEWALSTSWTGKPGGFFEPILTDVSNIGHPLFDRLAVPHIVLDFGGAVDADVHLVSIDAENFYSTYVEIVANGARIEVCTKIPPAVPRPEPLATSLGKRIYGHTANNDLSLWGSEYIRALYTLRDADLLGRLKGVDTHPCYFWIELLFQFGPYSNEPAHEPSGMLNSARLIPAISFQTDSGCLRRVRFDVRFDLCLESLDTRLKSEAFPAISILARDSEEAAPLWEVVRRPAGATVSETLAAVPFKKIEKPLVFEICGSGWRAESVHSASISSASSPAVPEPLAAPTPGAGAVSSATEKPEGTPLWDNVHFAPGKLVGLDYLPPLPSAPGAYYALHCHWRWGYFLSDYWYLYRNSSFLRVVDATLGQPVIGIDLYKRLMDAYFGTLHPDGRNAQYRGLKMTANTGGPLFDPNLANQSVQFAIVKTENAELAKAVKFDFVSHFRAGAKPEPESIVRGKALTWWLSFAPERTEILSNATGPDTFGGTLFAHGVHFAHNIQEPTSLFGPAGAASALSTGHAAYEPAHVPQTWER